ncbi:MAG: hypothetical protein HFE76_11370 [Firmicutes bacterium]|nr:hypothetical protein [Bacillota bacterium]
MQKELKEQQQAFKQEQQTFQEKQWAFREEQQELERQKQEIRNAEKQRAAEKRALAKMLKADNVDMEKIVVYTGLSRQEIQEL